MMDIIITIIIVFYYLFLYAYGLIVIEQTQSPAMEKECAYCFD